MLYDLTSEPPPPGSLLESVFMFISKRRHQASYHQTRVTMLASLATDLENGPKLLEEALDDYRVSLFPYLANVKQKQDKDHRKVLKQWTSKVLKIRPLWRNQDNKSVVSKLRRGAERVKQNMEARKHSKHRRIE